MSTKEETIFNMQLFTMLLAQANNEILVSFFFFHLCGRQTVLKFWKINNVRNDVPMTQDQWHFVEKKNLLFGWLDANI